ncbi:hypothetical protein [Rhizobium leguminosarum]
MAVTWVAWHVSTMFNAVARSCRLPKRSGKKASKLGQGVSGTPLTKPGGLVAVKDVDISVWQYQPQDPKLMWRLLDALSDDVQMSGAMRGTRVSAWFRAAGLENVSAITTLAERRQPLKPVEREYVRNNLEFLSGLARTRDLSEADHRQWKAIGEEPERLICDPNFCYREMWVLSLGTASKG